MTTWQCILCESTSLGSETRRSKVDLKICQWCESELARTGRLRCRRCNAVKPRSDFKARNARYCRECRAIAAVPYRAANRARVQARRAADPELRERDRLRTQA
jgi:late competence protein required for DNA uptake (superfamily II DNA/RNA helicase)